MYVPTLGLPTDIKMKRMDDKNIYSPHASIAVRYGRLIRPDFLCFTFYNLTLASLDTDTSRTLLPLILHGWHVLFGLPILNG